MAGGGNVSMSDINTTSLKPTQGLGHDEEDEEEEEEDDDDCRCY